MQSALDQPEILSYIAEFLTRSDYAQCAQVSRDWFRTFCPLVWKEIALTTRKSSWVDQRELYTESLVRHSDLVRKLVCDSFFLPKTNPDNKINHKSSDNNDKSKREKNKAALKAKVKTWKQEQQKKLRERHPLTFPYLEDLVFLNGYKFKCQPEIAHLSDSGSAQGFIKDSIASIFKENLGISKVKQLELDDINGAADQFDQHLLLLQSCPDLEQFKWEIPISIRQDIQRQNLNLGRNLNDSL
ncbi:hypothetical protein BGZ83_000118, partial [Gryganskiella cystojenkinii]